MAKPVYTSNIFRRKFIFKVFIVCFPLLTGHGPAAQNLHPANHAETEVLALENAWNQAVQLRESHALQPLFVENLVYIDYDGRLMNKGQYLAYVQTPVRHPEHIVSESMIAHVYGNSVVVTGVYRERGIKNREPYVLRERFVDTWILQKSLWVCVSSQSTLIVH